MAESQGMILTFEAHPDTLSARGDKSTSRLIYEQQVLAAGNELYTPRRSGRFDPQVTLNAFSTGSALPLARSPIPTPRLSWPDTNTTAALGTSVMTPRQRSPQERSVLDRSSWLPSPRQSFAVLRAASAEGSVDCSTISKQVSAQMKARSLFVRN